MRKILKSISLVSIMFAIIVVGFGSSIAQASTYTIADVATHNTSSDCWVVVNNNVYNLTNFISSHSGGSAVITAQCGKDGTVAFNSGPHNANTLNAISSYLLGTLTTVSPVLTSLTVVPTSPSIIIGGTINLSATPKDQNGVNFTGATKTFSSDNTAIATVNSTSGQVTGIAVGTATITATVTSGSITISKTSTVTVTNVSPTLTLNSVKITPTSPNVKIGKNIQLTVKTKNQNGGIFTGATITFTSNNTSIASVDGTSGKVTGIAVGTATITATGTYGDKVVSDTVTVTVTDTNINNPKGDDKDDNGNHFGQFKNWFKKWFNNHKINWGNKGGINKNNDYNNQNDHGNKGNGKNDR